MRQIKWLIVLLLMLLPLCGAFYVDFHDNGRVLKVRYLNQADYVKGKHSILHQALSEIGDVVLTDGDDYDVIIDGVFGKEALPRQRGVKIFYTGEPLPPKLTGYDLSLGFDEIKQSNYMRLPVQYIEPVNKHLDFTQHKHKGSCNPNKKYFACFLVSNKGDDDPLGRSFDGCPLRNRIFHKLSLYKKVHSGGKYLNTENAVVPREETLQWLSNCKFVIAYENTVKYPKYVSEKPFQAYYSGAVPIYHGHSSFVRDVNPKAIVYAGNFQNEDALVEYIKELDKDDEQYCNIWQQNILLNPEQNYSVVKDNLRERISQLLVDKGDNVS